MLKWHLCPWALVVLGASVLFLALHITTKADAQQFRDTRMREKACKSIDIRNNVRSFAKLQNCTVIEGNLKILLIDSALAAEYENISFPELREITEYLLLFRVTGLRSLKKLFPNLSVIRGAKLFYNYAFVVYEMLSLQEIGLPKLTHIMRGAIRIEKNPDLCYVDTIDWDLIARNPLEPPTIKGNKKIDECPDQCPDGLPAKCPSSKKSSGDRNAKLCWSGTDCQKVCNTSKCVHSSCKQDDPNFCCHEECLGGCSGPLQSDCFACKQIFFDGYCTDSCPDNTYKFQERRCLSYADCKAQTTLDGQNDTSVYKPFQGLCSLQCPAGYVVNATDPSNCTKCVGLCPKICVGETISNIADAQRFAACTEIHGSLEIQISGGNNVVAELHKSLGLVQVITGYLKIVRSYPLMSFDFLASLKTIRGQAKHDERYALYVLDNANLQNLWAWGKQNHSLNILSGLIFFHFNPKLCIEKIRELEKLTGLNHSDARDVSPYSNGDRVACNVTKLDVWIESNNKNAVIVRWRNVVNLLDDARLLLGYTVSYKEAPGSKNLTFFDDHDACATDSWKVEDVPANEGGGQGNVTLLIPHLKPYTRYGLYVKTSMVALSPFGAISELKHFVTYPDNPSTPVDLKAWSNSSSNLIVSWKPPNTPNGLVTHYVIVGDLKEDNQNFLDLRNFCTDAVRYVVSSKPDEVPKVSPDLQKEHMNNTCQLPGGKCCACPKEKKELEEDERKRKSEIEFEDYLHNTVYIPRPDSEDERRRRDLGGAFHFQMVVEDHFHHRIRRAAERKPNALPTLYNSTTAPSVILPGKLAPGKTPEGVSDFFSKDDFIGDVSFRVTINFSTEVAISKLKHFSEYTIKVYACHDKEPNTSQKKLCSNEAITTARTKPADGVDDIHKGSIVATVQNQTTSTVLMKWKAPVRPNGLVVTFHIEMERQETKTKVTHCITHKQYELEQGGYTASGLTPGNYSLRIRSTSMSGPGGWSAPIFFFIPEPSTSWGTGVVVGIVFAVVLVLAGVVGFTVWLTIKRRPPIPVNGNIVSVNPEYFSADGVYMPDEWEVPRDKVTLIKELGQGSFGMVYEGIARDLVDGKPEARCAVKTVNESASMRERFEFLNEASVMKTFQCYHVVKLLGVVSKGQPILVVMELMANGDLKTYLRSHRPDEGNPETRPPTLKMILQMAVEIADGMAYLSNRKYVHRDLAARNCMVADDLTVKIGDFGMTRDIYENDYYRKGGKGLLPVRWMAPESLKDGVFTSQSDVWSYGIVLWEMATLASQPYQGLSNEQVLKYVIDGGVIEEPENCPQNLYYLMKQCWHYHPKTRPTFIQIIESLLEEASPSFKEFSFYFSPRDPPPPSGKGPTAAYDDFDHEVDDDDEREDEEATEMNCSPSTPLRSPAQDGTGSGRRSDDEQESESGALFSGRSPQQRSQLSTLLRLPRTFGAPPSDGDTVAQLGRDDKTSTRLANGNIVVNGRPGMRTPLTRDTKC